MTEPVTDFGASARARLLNLTKSRQSDFQLAVGPPTDFGGRVDERVIAFLEPRARAVSAGAGFTLAWQPGGPWR